MDVMTALLHRNLEEEIYIEQPEGFIVKGKEDHVCKLWKSLHGLKQKFSDDDFIILLLYVDDMLIVDRNASKSTV
ncbi:Retrovirus-related Pol polyprotein from transposon TNT 1-94-like protein [Drosera capensis]